MKILSRMLVVLLILLGIAFLVLEGRAYAAAKRCLGVHELKLGLDANGCETKQPLQVTESTMNEWLGAARIPKECYKIRTYKKHKPDPYRGDLVVVACSQPKGPQSPKGQVRQPTGNGQTQRIMFTSLAMKEAFERQTQVAENQVVDNQLAQK